MTKVLTEKDVLKKLDIPDFRHLSKETIMNFASMLPDMDPEVAMKAIEQFPELTATMKASLQDCKEVVAKTFDSNDSSMEAYYSACNKMIDTLSTQLESEGLSIEERLMLVKELGNVRDAMGEKDTENKSFLMKNAAVFCTTVVVIGLSAAAIIGGKIDISAIGRGASKIGSQIIEAGPQIAEKGSKVAAALIK